MTIEPDDKDWTWVLERHCEECGFEASSVERADIASMVRASAGSWPLALTLPEAATRSDPDRWSVLEYACHVRDVHLLFGQRLNRMLTEDDPEFESWDQDETAKTGSYDEQDPAVVSEELVEAAERVADQYAAVGMGEWQRHGRRSDGSEFTVESLGRYHLHDVLHHQWDVGSAPCDTPSSGPG